MAAYEENEAPERRAENEREAPSEKCRNEPWIEENDRGSRAERGSDPVRAVDDKVDATANVGGHKLVDRGVDGGALPTDACPRDGAPEGEARKAEREPRHQRGRAVDRERDEEEPPPAEGVRETSEDEGPGDRSREVRARRDADLRIGEVQG